MAESRLFMLGTVKDSDVVNRLESFFRSEKGMDVQSVRTTDGYVLQASEQKDGWKTISGMRLAVTVQIVTLEDKINVTVGEGQWSDKIGAGAIGLFIAWPLAITAGMGAYKQKKLPAEVFGVIETFLISGGRTAAVTGAGSRVENGMAVCPSCKAQVPQGSKFCNRCGAKLDVTCPACGAALAAGSLFCSECGHKL